MPKLPILFLALCLLITPFASANAQASLTPEMHRAIVRIDVMAQSEYEKDRAGGLTIGVVVGPRLVWTASYGFADRHRHVPAARTTRYRIGSITKMFTALMLLQLVERGVVHLSDPVERFLPQVSQIERRYGGSPPITFVQLATHTSGLATEPEGTLFSTGSLSGWEATLLSALPHTIYVAEPGVRHNYSNVGYAILGAALARSAGERYVDYVERHILAPLGMRNTGYEVARADRRELARGYNITDGNVSTEVSDREHDGRGYRVPNGGLYSTVDDLARFISFQLGEDGGEVLSQTGLGENRARWLRANEGLTGGNGLGFEVFRSGEFVFFGHGGSVVGYESGILFHPATRTGLIVLRNANGGGFNIGSFAVASMAILAQAGVPPSR